MKGFRLSEADLKRMRKIQLDLMEEFDAFCERNRLKYVITGGTLLGAVRHGGFIPWDDDADIAMTREDYEKMKRLVSDLNSDTIFFQDHDTDPGYLWGYGKLRRPHTTLIRAGQEHLTGNTGVFIDVFPMDDIPASIPAQIMSYCMFLVCRKILWAQVAVRDRTLSPCFRVLYKCLSRISPERVYRFVKWRIRYSKNDRRRLVHPWARPLWSRGNKEGVPLNLKYGMKKSWFLKRKKYAFEDRVFWGTADADAFLRYCYGDYMVLPPKAEQKPQLLFSGCVF